MLFTLSPAKKLDYETPLPDGVAATQPLFVDDAATLIETLRQKSPDEIAALMKLSDNLAELNARRYAEWRPAFGPKSARPAVFAFNGDVYEGLDVRSLPTRALDWTQDHLVILSGLYGALRPLDYMRAYRLEMGTRLAVGKARTLYAYWGGKIAEYLNERLAEQPGSPVLVNLASEEYFKSVKLDVLKARVVQCVFEDWKRDEYKVISFHAKRARGLMTRYAALHRIDQPEGLKGFDLEGYAYAAGASSTDRLVFRRKTAA
jgi:cytoplasmic iron level regulating protein YaaA (DUF328/UPF0246 family)